MSASSLSAFRAAIVRSVWSSKLLLAQTPGVLNLLDGPVGVDPAFHIVSCASTWPTGRWRYSVLFRVLDLLTNGAPSTACSSAANFCC